MVFTILIFWHKLLKKCDAQLRKERKKLIDIKFEHKQSGDLLFITIVYQMFYAAMFDDYDSRECI